MATFGENIRALRMSRGYSQEKFARVIGSNQANITAWERNTRMPSFETVMHIAETMHVPISTLLPVGESGKEEDRDRELLDCIKSNNLILGIVNEARSLSNDDLDVVYKVVCALSGKRVKTHGQD